MHPGRLSSLGLGDEPICVPLHVHQIGEAWATMIVADDVMPPEPVSLKGTAFFGETQEEAEERAKAYLGLSEPIN